MTENRNSVCGCPSGTLSHSDSVYIDVNRILDSCRDRDCFEDVRVYLPDIGQELIERAASVRARSAEIVDTCINVTPMTFNRGFYQIAIRLFIRMEFEVCVCGKAHYPEGLAVVDKNVILFGSEGSVRIFRSKENGDPCCNLTDNRPGADDNLPTAVLEVVDPVVLCAKVVEKCMCKPISCGCGCESTSCGGEVPEHVLRCFSGTLCDAPEIARYLVVSLGFFSVVRMERPAQFLVSATEYGVPDKECVFCDDEDPCAVFRRMAFPVDEFSPPAPGAVSSLCRGEGHGERCPKDRS